MKKLELIDINKSYETNVPVLKNVSFSVENGEFLVLLGPSGCGKSTILSIIAGFEKQNDGNIIIDGRNCDTVSCQNRDIAMVFQNYALYPNMNVYNNIAFPLVNRREKKEVIKEKVITISKMLQIPAVKYGLNTYEITYIVGPIADEYINGKISLEEALNKMSNEAVRIEKASGK